MFFMNFEDAWKCPEFDSNVVIYQEHKKCDKYYQCSNGRPYEMSCPPGTYWDQDQKTCSTFVDCGNRQ